MTLTDLRYLVALARERHFGHAAERCNVSQPTLSVALKKVEGQIGAPLFERGSNDIRITPLGERIVEQARNANVVEIRLHAGMYRAMLAEHKRRVKAGGECEPAAANQGVPQNLAATIKDLPMVTRVQFRNVLREGGRIPQEILMTADYRDGDSGSFDRMLNN